jgi:predicted enzyme related to lactoylglutathione lyase
MNAKLGTVIIYARDITKTALFYSKHFGLTTTGEVVEA